MLESVQSFTDYKHYLLSKTLFGRSLVFSEKSAFKTYKTKDDLYCYTAVEFGPVLQHTNISKNFERSIKGKTMYY